MHQDRLLGCNDGLAMGRAKTIGAMITCAIMVVCSFVIILEPDLSDLTTIRKACDRAVEAVLISRDPVELQRSDILIRALDCSVSRRLPKEP